MFRRQICAALAAAAALAACRSPAPPPPADAASRAEATLREALAEGERAWARRGDPEGLAAALATFRRAAAARPGDPAAELALSRAEAFRALAGPGAREAWMASARAAERALRRLAPGWAQAVDDGAPASDAAGRVGPEGAEALYRVALGTLRAAQESGYAALLAAKDSALPMLERAAALDGALDAGGPDRALGALRAALPSAAGGGAALARAHFDRARSLAPADQLANVLEAETYAVLVQDAALFDRLLASVLAFEPEALPERAPENRIAQARARELQERRSRLF